VKSRANGNPKQKGGMYVSQSPRHPVWVPQSRTLYLKSSRRADLLPADD
jgi:hypothetical protein